MIYMISLPVELLCNIYTNLDVKSIYNLAATDSRNYNVYFDNKTYIYSRLSKINNGGGSADNLLDYFHNCLVHIKKVETGVYDLSKIKQIIILFSKSIHKIAMYSRIENDIDFTSIVADTSYGNLKLMYFIMINGLRPERNTHNMCGNIIMNMSIYHVRRLFTTFAIADLCISSNAIFHRISTYLLHGDISLMKELIYLSKPCFRKLPLDILLDNVDRLNRLSDNMSMYPGFHGKNNFIDLIMR